MSDIYESRAEGSMIDKPVAKGALTREKMKARSRGRLASLDYLFYVVAAVAIFAFIFDLYAFRHPGRLYLPEGVQVVDKGKYGDRSHDIEEIIERRQSAARPGLHLLARQSAFCHWFIYH